MNKTIKEVVGKNTDEENTVFKLPNFTEEQLADDMVTAAWAAVRVKNSYLQAQFHRLRARRGAKKAILAVAASMLTAAYHMLKEGVEYRDLGAEHFTQRDRSKAIQRPLKRLTDLGCEVQLQHAT